MLKKLFLFFIIFGSFNLKSEITDNYELDKEISDNFKNGILSAACGCWSYYSAYYAYKKTETKEINFLYLFPMERNNYMYLSAACGALNTYDTLYYFYKYYTGCKLKNSGKKEGGEDVKENNNK